MPRASSARPYGHSLAMTGKSLGPRPRGEQRFSFRGGLILISNRPLADLAELRALATRIEVHRLEVSDAELTALMRHLARDGYERQGQMVVEPEHCIEVTEHLLKECHAAGCPLDLRLQQKAFQTYMQWAAEWSSSHWHDLVTASVREASHHFRHEQNTTPREDRHADRRNLIRILITDEPDSAEQIRIYKETTGASRADFYRRREEVLSGEFDEYDKA
jgi:hypothetical protein